MLRKAVFRAAVISLAFLPGLVRSQDSPTPEPTVTPKSRSARVSFLPPPLEGTISLGIYDTKGTLVRTLHREADINEFKIGADALLTTWDGKNDSGDDVPPGKYRAHGFVVGDLTVEGVGFFFNDWITTNDSPRVRRIQSIKLQDDKLLLGVELVRQGNSHVTYDLAQKTLAKSESIDPNPMAAASPSDSILTAAGRGETRWVIERASSESTVAEAKQLSASGEVLRHLSFPQDQPQPIGLAPSTTQDKLYLLEQNDAVQRVRGLIFTSEASSDAKIDFEKSITAHQDFSIANGKPVASSSKGAAPPSSVKIKMQPNPLLDDERISLELVPGFDADGTFLKTTDGLPLCSISETPGIVRSLINNHASNTIDFFQDDGSVVEQFRVSGVDQMMSFDCGSFELK